MPIDTWIKIWRAGFAFAIFGVAQFLVCNAFAMLAYQGGTINDHTTVGYLQTQNYLSDLGRRQSLSGNDNKTAAILFNGSTILLGFSVIPFFVFIATQAYDQLGFLIATSAIGVISSFCLIFIGVRPVDFYPFQHVMGLCLWLVAIILLSGIHAIAMLMSKVNLTWLGLLSVGLMMITVLYGFHAMKTGAALFRGEEMPLRAVVLQKLMVLSALGWFVANSLQLLLTNDFSEFRDRAVGKDAEKYIDAIGNRLR